MPTMLRKDFDEFLFAPAGQDPDGMPVTLLTVLARLGVDPWEEAADLAHLSRETALQRLAARLEAMPNGPASAADTVNVATRLISLLHRVPARKAPLPEVPPLTEGPEPPKAELPPRAEPPPGAEPPSKRSNWAIYWLIGLICMLVAQWALST